MFVLEKGQIVPFKLLLAVFFYSQGDSVTLSSRPDHSMLLLLSTNPKQANGELTNNYCQSLLHCTKSVYD